MNRILNLITDTIKEYKSFTPTTHHITGAVNGMIILEEKIKKLIEKIEKKNSF